ncbi:MAG: hypothetical protein ACLS58_08255 [Sutterella wadsworthensis]
MSSPPLKAEWTMEDWSACDERARQPSGAGRDGTHHRNRVCSVLLSPSDSSRARRALRRRSRRAQNTSAFISAFRQVFGMTPGEYRRTLQGA